MTTLFLAWQDPDLRRWFPVGRLDAVDDTGDREYRFAYTQGALVAQQEAGFEALSSFPELRRVYSDSKMFPLFSNRVMPRSRPEYAEFAQWLSIPRDEDDPVAVLARSGGRRATDTLEIFAAPRQDAEGWLSARFFVHGVRHQTEAAQARVMSLEPGEPLLVQADLQNPRDPEALSLRTSEQTTGDMHTVGYLPRYLTHGVRDRLIENPADIQVAVQRLNEPPSPVHFRLMCQLRGRWPEDVSPWAVGDYEPLQST